MVRVPPELCEALTGEPTRSPAHPPAASHDRAGGPLGANTGDRMRCAEPIVDPHAVPSGTGLALEARAAEDRSKRPDDSLVDTLG